MLLADTALDYALVRVQGAPCASGPDDRDDWTFAPLRIDRREPAAGSPMPIIHHSGGAPKKISTKNFTLDCVEDGTLYCYTSTDTGSSGAPVFNARFDVVGIHLADTPIGHSKYGRNRGRAIDSVLEDIRGKSRDLYSEIESATAAR